MDVYVVLDCAWRDGAEVAGVATELQLAMDVAKRSGDREDDARLVGWGEWTPAGPLSNRCLRWTRHGLDAEGIHPSIYQEIVKTPLTESA